MSEKTPTPKVIHIHLNSCTQCSLSSPTLCSPPTHTRFCFPFFSPTNHKMCLETSSKKCVSVCDPSPGSFLFYSFQMPFVFFCHHPTHKPPHRHTDTHTPKPSPTHPNASSAALASQPGIFFILWSVYPVLHHFSLSCFLN